VWLLYIQETAFFTVTAVKISNLYITLTGWFLYRRCNVSPVKYELGFYIPEDDILHSHCRENLIAYIAITGWTL
jgi:hypothetical protein